MGKIECSRNDGSLQVGFGDYPFDSQLKDFYKLFKKASGHSVQEYRETGNRIEAVTDNAKDSLGFGWTEAQGAFVSAQAADARELVRVVWNMLCYRYGEYRAYGHLLEGLTGADQAGTKADTARPGKDAVPAGGPDEAGADSDGPDPEEEQAILADITGLLGLVE